MPIGIHSATLREIKIRFGYNEHRKQLLIGLESVIKNLKTAGCKRVYLNGSFVSNKEFPRDFDLCWEPKGVDFELLDPLFVLTRYVLPPRRKQQEKYGGEIIMTKTHPAAFDMLSYFQLDDRTGLQKELSLSIWIEHHDQK